jgi:hypothetical protein
MPGERVRIWDGVISINGARLKESYTETQVPSDLEYPPRRLGPDEYFVIGDNRATSIFRPVRREDIIGKVVY